MPLQSNLLTYEASSETAEETIEAPNESSANNSQIITIDTINTAGSFTLCGIYDAAEQTTSGWYIHNSTTSLTSVSVNGRTVFNSRYFTTSTSTATNFYTVGDVWRSTANTVFTSNWIDRDVDWQAIYRHAKPQTVKKSTRNSIKRALKLMCGMGFEEDVRVFLKGDEVEVSHPDSLLKFVITRLSGRSLIHYTENPGHIIPYGLQLQTKTGIHVANLCVYMEETPVLDQVLGVAMFIKSGSEEMILSQANWSGLTSDMELREILALEYPYLQKKLRLNEKRLIENSGPMNLGANHIDRSILQTWA